MTQLPNDYREKLRRRQEQQVEDKGKTGLGRSQVLDYEKSPVAVKEWKPKYMPNENAIDIIPFIISEPWFKNLKEGPAGRPMGIDTGYPWYKLQVPVHFGVGPDNQNLLCLREAFGKECCQCDEMFNLYNQGKKDDGKKLKSGWRTYYVIYDYDEPDKGFQLWDVSYYMFEATTSMDPQRVNLLDAQNLSDGGVVPFFDIDGGSTVIAKFKKKTMGSNEYAEVDSISFESRDAYTYEEIIQNGYPLDKMLTIPTPEQFSNAFYGINPDEEEGQEQQTSSGSTGGRSRSRSTQTQQTQQTQQRQTSQTENPPDNTQRRGRAGEQAPGFDKEGDWGQCPADGSFGHDCNTLDECQGNMENSCDEKTFQECVSRHEKISTMANDPDPEPEPEQTNRGRGRGTGGTQEQTQSNSGGGRSRGRGNEQKQTEQTNNADAGETRRRRR